MPAQPKSQSSTVILWNKGRSDSNGIYRAGTITLYHTVKASDDTPTPVLNTVFPGLCEAPRDAWEIALKSAKAIAAGPQKHHDITDRLDKGRLAVIKSIDAMSDDDAQAALEQTTSKRMLLAVAQGKHGSTHQEKAVKILSNWGSETMSKPRMITEHFASYQRAG